MGWGSCSHQWRDYGHAVDGHQQQSCSKCGQVRSIRVRGGLFHTHSYPAGRPGSTVSCACGHRKRV